MQRFLIVLLAVSMSAQRLLGDTFIVNEPFDSYINNTALHAQWVPSGSANNGVLWSTNTTINPDANPDGGDGVDHVGGNVMVWNTPFSIAPSATQNVVLQGDLYDQGNSNNKRMSIGLRQNAGTGNLFEIGMWNSAPAPYYSFRMVGFPGLVLPPEHVNGWVAFTNMVDDLGNPITNFGIGDPRWLRYRVEFSETQATIELDLNRDGSINGSAVVPYTSFFDGGFENLRIGGPSGVASAGGGVVFDNIQLSLVDLPDPNSFSQLPGTLNEGTVNRHELFSLPPGATFYAYTDNTVGNIAPDTMLRALDTLGNQVAFDDDSGALGNGLASHITSTVNSDGSIRLDVTGYPDFDFSGDHTRVGDYTLFVQVGEGDPADSNVFPTDFFGGVEVVRHYLRNSFPTAQVELSIGNDGTGATSFSVIHQPNGELIDPELVLHMPIAPGSKQRFLTVAELPTDVPSGRYTASAEVINEVNPNDTTEVIDLAIEIYDAPALTDNSANTIQVDLNPTLTVANAQPGPHPGALRAGATVTDVAVSGRGFGLEGLEQWTYIAAGEQHAASATFDRFGQLSGLHTGTISVNLEMSSGPFDFLNGAEPMPPVEWNVEYTLETINVDSAIVDLFGSFDDRIGVNNENTAATLVDGAAASAQTISMQFVASPGDGFSTVPQLASDMVNLGFSTPGDTYVLQFTYADENIPPTLSENDLSLIFFDGDDWRFAVNGNSDGGAGSSFFAGSYDDYLASINGGAPALSAFGVDSASNQLWAVLDHAASFAAGSIFPAPHGWIAADAGNWSDPLNWNSGVIPSGDRTGVLFDDAATPTTVTVDSDITLREIVFDGITYGYTIESDNIHHISLAENALIEVRSGSHVIAAPMVGSNGLVKTGTGTLVLVGNNPYQGSTFVTEGRLVINGIQSGGGDYVVNAGGTLGGSGTIQGSVSVDGRLAPGNSPGILTIDGNYTQSTNGVLEIEVGGLVPGTEHDQVVVTGNASLAGQLDVPIFGSYVPAENDEITFLTTGPNNFVEGTFRSITSPNLASVNPNLALKVSYSDPQNVRLQFVAASSDIQFVTQEAEASWGGFETWTNGQEPDTTNIVTVNNVSGAPQQVNVTHGSAMVHQLNVVGQTDTITLSIQNGSTFSATTSVNIDSKAVVELVDRANLVSSQVTVQPGGVLSGNGTVVGDLVVGTTVGQAEAIVSPGLSAGHLDVQGNYEQGAGGTLAIEIQGTDAGQFDTVRVTGQAKLGGTLTVDVSELGAFVPGTLVEILDAGDLAGIFERVETIGNEDIFFAPIYGGPLAGGADLGQGSNVTGSGVVGCLSLDGDMNCNGRYDGDDIQKFALALAKPEAYFGSFFIEGVESGDVDDNGTLDFDDIDDFAELVPGASTAAIAAAVLLLQQPVPEPTTLALILWCGGSMMMTRSRRALRKTPIGALRVSVHE